MAKDLVFILAFLWFELSSPSDLFLTGQPIHECFGREHFVNNKQFNSVGLSFGAIVQEIVYIFKKKRNQSVDVLDRHCSRPDVTSRLYKMAA